MAPDDLFENIISIANQQLLCYVSSLILNCDTNAVESFNDKQAMLTGGKRLNLSLSWGWIYRFGSSVLSWNSSQQDAAEAYIRLVKGEDVHTVHRIFTAAQEAKRKQHRRSEPNEPDEDYTEGISSHLSSTDFMPISFDENFNHPLATREVSAQNQAVRLGAGYSSIGEVERPDLPEVELYEERDRVLRFILRAHNDRHGVSVRTIRRQESEEYQNIKTRILFSEVAFLICKFITGSKEQRVKSWPSKAKTVLYENGFRYSERMLMEQKMVKIGLSWLSEHLHVKIEECGIIFDADCPFLVAEPSGFLEECNVQVIYLFEGRKLPINEAITKSKIFERDNRTDELWLLSNSMHFCKIQADMAICGKRACVVVVTTDTEQLSFETLFSEQLWEPRKTILTDFFYYCLVEQADPNRSRSLPPRSYLDVQTLCESEKWRTWPLL